MVDLYCEKNKRAKKEEVMLTFNSPTSSSSSNESSSSENDSPSNKNRIDFLLKQ